MSELSPGFTYIDNSTAVGGTQTFTNSHQLIDGMTIKNILTTELESGTRVIKAGVERSGLRDQDFLFEVDNGWLITNRETSNTSSTELDDISGRVLRARNSGETTIAKGELLKIGGGRYGVLPMHISGSLYSSECCFVSSVTMESLSGYKTVVASGLVQALVTGDLFPGDIIVASDVTGYGRPERNTSNEWIDLGGTVVGFSTATRVGPSGLTTIMMIG